MLIYYVKLAWRQLWHNPVMTALMVVAIGLGIGASMTMLTVLHVMSDDPLPGRSSQLFYPHIDPLPVRYQVNWGYDPSDNFTWPDAQALLSAHRAEKQAAMAGGTILLRSPVPDGVPFRIDGRYATAEIFDLFGIRFAQGHGWSAADDANRARVVVLAESLAHRLFGSENPLGRMVRLEDADFRVIGVIHGWDPHPNMLADGASNVFGKPDVFFLPLSAAADLNFSSNGSFGGWGGNDEADRMHSPTTSWIQVWVQLSDPAGVNAYRQFLVDYSAQQKALGRFERAPTAARLDGLMQHLQREHIVPGDVRLQLWLALGFLLVCVINIVALLLAKFLRRSNELSVRRALGASRIHIFIQLGMESLMVGLAGGVLGLVLAQVGLWIVRQRPDDYAQLAHMDIDMLLITFILAIFACLLAGLLPAWRASRIPPALQMKQF